MATHSKKQESNELIDIIFESLVHPFYIIDAESHEIVKANSAALEGRDPNAKTCHLLTHQNKEPCSAKEHGCPLKEVLKTAEPAKMIHTHFDKDGNPRQYEVHGYPIKKDDKVVKMIEYSIDITDQLRAQEESERALKAMEESERLQQELIESQKLTIRDLSTPIIEVWERILVVPIVGFIDIERGRDITQKLLESVSEKHARGVIIDVTAIEVMDTGATNQFIKMAKGKVFKSFFDYYEG